MNRRKLLCYFESSYLQETFQEISDELCMSIMFKKQWSQLHPILLSKQIDTLIIECSEPNEEYIVYLKQALQKGLVRNIFFLTYHEIHQKLIQQRHLLNLPKGWYNIMLPELTENLKTLLIKTSSGVLKVKNQKFPRYETNQSVVVHSLSNSKSMESKMINISYGGLQCTYLSEFEFKLGDFVRLNVKLDQINKSHTMNAKIVWIDPDSPKATKRMGLEFISNQDMYTEMLNYV